MQNYADNAYLIDIEDPNKHLAAKLGIEKEWNDFKEEVRKSGYLIFSFTPEYIRGAVDDRKAEALKSLRILQDKFIEKYGCSFHLVYINENCEGFCGCASRGIFLAIDEEELYERIPTKKMEKLQEVGAEPEESSWTVCL
jgi:hypothetical protein